VGLSSLTGTLIRTGGTAKRAPAELDEQVEFLAAQLSSFGGDTRAGANLQCVTTVLDDSLDLLFEMLREPRFDEERLTVEKGNVREAMRQRNDDADDVLGREWDFLLFGEDHYSTRRMTVSHLERITRDDMVRFHESYWRPENMIFAVSGDVDTESFLAKLDTYLRDWPGSGASASWPPPQPTLEPEPGLYHVEKDIPQGKVLIGHRVPRWEDWTSPDRAAIQVMDHILGASGFTSRIMKRIRSDEGLAYSARASFGFDPFEPGTFSISFQSKSETVALAASIALEEVRKIREAPVSDEELTVAKSALVETFPRRFESAGQLANIFANDAFIGRGHSYWQRWREQIRAVTGDDVQRVAREYLHPDEMLFLVVGHWDAIEPGDPDGRASMAEFYGGAVKHLPLRDPLTLQ
jgi:predicted Zn-dependent peptidase